MNDEDHVVGTMIDPNDPSIQSVAVCGIIFPMPQIEQKKSPAAQMASVRLIWLMLLLGQLGFAVITVFVVWPGKQFVPNPQLAHQFNILALIMLVVLVPAGFVIRHRTYGDAQQGIPAGKYLTGNIIFFSLCEAVSFAGLIGMLLSGQVGESVVVPAIAIAIQILNYPNGNTLLK